MVPPVMTESVVSAVLRCKHDQQLLRLWSDITAGVRSVAQHPAPHQLPLSTARTTPRYKAGVRVTDRFSLTGESMRALLLLVSLYFPPIKIIMNYTHHFICIPTIFIR